MPESSVRARNPDVQSGFPARPRLPLATPPVARPRRQSRRKFLVAGAVLVAALGYLIYAGISSTMMYYLTPSELLARGQQTASEQVRIGGLIAENTIHTEPKTLTLHFSVIDKDGDPANKRAIPVIYKGVVPDSFKPDAEVVLEGKLTSAGVFEATTLLAKCPSKYEPAG